VPKKDYSTSIAYDFAKMAVQSGYCNTKEINGKKRRLDTGSFQLLWSRAGNP
jgi:hypothetical protein